MADFSIGGFSESGSVIVGSLIMISDEVSIPMFTLYSIISPIFTYFSTVTILSSKSVNLVAAI